MLFPYLSEIIQDPSGSFLFSMSLDERKRNFEIAVEECDGKAGVIVSVSDQNFDTVRELAHHAEDCGADYIVVHAPVLSFVHERGEVLYQYYKALCDRLDIGIAMWSHPDSGYLMQPEECARIAELPNIVAIKYSVPRDMYVRLTHMVGDRIQVSTSLEDDWLDNIEELGNWDSFVGRVRHMLIPVTGYMIGGFATMTILMKNSLLENLGAGAGCSMPPTTTMFSRAALWWCRDASDRPRTGEKQASLPSRSSHHSSRVLLAKACSRRSSMTGQ